MSFAPRVLVIRRRYLGDIVLLGSVFRNLRLHWPDAHLAVLVEAGCAGIPPLHPDVNATLILPRSLLAWPGFIRRLRRERFTHVLDFDNSDKTALITRLTGAMLRVTYQRELVKHRYPSFYTHTARVTNAFYDSHHITETYLALLAPLGVPVITREVRLVPRAEDLAAVAPLAAGPGRKVLLHPGSRSPFRVWPAERFAAVCDRLQDELGVQVFVIGGPGDRDTVEKIRATARTHLVALEPRLTVGRFAALASQFDLFLCHDSGPMHIATAVGTPVVALYGSQNAVIWRPVGESHTVLQTRLPCTCLPDVPTPCVKTDSYRSYCVRQLGVEEVFAAVRERLKAGTR
jgi:lipopolysaccharide heptosyltransferase II